MPAYMNFEAVAEYRLNVLGIRYSSHLMPKSTWIDGEFWIPTDLLKSIMNVDEFREMECHVTTWVTGGLSPLPNMPEGTYHRRRNGQLKYWRNLPIRYQYRRSL